MFIFSLTERFNELLNNEEYDCKNDGVRRTSKMSYKPSSYGLGYMELSNTKKFGAPRIATRSIIVELLKRKLHAFFRGLFLPFFSAFHYSILKSICLRTTANSVFLIWFIL